MALPDPECSGHCSPRPYMWGVGGSWYDSYFNWYYGGVATGLGAFVNRPAARMPPLLGSGGTVIPKQGDWVFLASGPGRSYGILADGSLWGWGQAPVGDGTLNSYSNPKKISKTGERWKYVATTPTHTLAIKEDGSLWSWGSNDFGQLGNGNKYPGFTTNPRVLLSGSIEFINFPKDGVSIGNRDPQTVTFQKSDGNDPGAGATAEYDYECRLTGGVNLSSRGVGYKSQPTVVVQPTGSTQEIAPASFSVSMKYAVASVAIEDGGSGYASDCVVVFSEGLRGETAEGEPVFSEGALTSITITKGGEYSSPPSISIKGRKVTQAVISIVMSGYVSEFSLVSGGAYTGRSLSISISGGSPTAPATISGTPTFDTKITSVAITNGGSGYTSTAGSPLKAKIGDFILGEAVLSPCSAVSISPTEDNAWTNGTGTVQPFETRLFPPDSGVINYFGFFGSLLVRENPPSPSVSLVSYGMDPIPLSVSFVGTPVPDGGLYYYADGLFNAFWSASLGQSVSGIKGPIALKVDWPEMEFEKPVGGQVHAMGTPPASGEPAGADGGATIYGFNQHNLEAYRWYVAEALVPFAPAGLTSIVDGSDLVSVVQTGFLQDPLDPEPECPPTPPTYNNVLTGDYCILPLLNTAPKDAKAWYGRKGTYRYGNSTMSGFPEYIPKTKFTVPAVSAILPAAKFFTDTGYQIPVSASDPPTTYPTPAVIINGDNEGPPCSISANFSAGKCFYSITSPGSGYRTEPLVTVTATHLTPTPVIGGHRWKQVAVKAGESSGLLEDGTPMRWPIYGHFDPQKIGFSIAITEQESYEGISPGGVANGVFYSGFRKTRDTKYSTPSNVDQLLPQTPGTLALNPSTAWLGTAGRREIRTHVGVPRLLYRLRAGQSWKVYVQGWGANRTDLVGNQIPVTIDGQPRFAHEFPIPMNGVGPYSEWSGFYGTYWHSPPFPDYSSEYLFSEFSTNDRAGYVSNMLGSCFTEAPTLGDGVTATLVSPGPCKELFYAADGALYATAVSGEVWVLSGSSRKIAPSLGQDVPLQYETIKFHETKFSVKWSWELEDREVEWGLYSIGCPGSIPSPDGSPGGSPCVTETLKYKTLKPPSKEVVDESCDWGRDIEIIKDQVFCIELTSGGSGYCREDAGTNYPVDDRPYIRLSGGRVLVGFEEVTDGGGIDIESETYSRDSVSVPYQNNYYPWQPSSAGFSTPDAFGGLGFYFGGWWFGDVGLGLHGGGYYAGGKAASSICNIFFSCESKGSPQKSSISEKAIKSLTWKDFSHRSEPVYVDLPDISIYPGVSFLDGKVVSIGDLVLNLPGTYGYSGFNAIVLGFTELPSVEFVFQRGSGSGATVALKPASSRFSSPRPVDKFKSASPVLLVREDGRLCAPAAGAPLPETYGSNFSNTEGALTISGEGKVYDVTLGGHKPWPSPNLSVTINSPGSGYTLLPRIEVSQPSQKIATAAVEFNGKLVSLGVDNGGFGYTSPPTLDIDGSGEGECVISGPVSLVELTAGGSGYSHPPKVRFTGPGWPGKATCSLGDGGAVASVSVQGGGDYRSAPGVAFDPIPEVTSVSISSGGSGYTSNPRVEIVGNCGGGGATATAKINGQVTEVEVTFGGSGYSSDSPPQVVFSGGGGSGAAATATVDDETGAVTGVEVTSGGSWYTSKPSVKITGGSGRGASGRATIAGPVGSLTLTNGGRDYLESPTVLFIGGQGDGAAATATLGTRGSGAAATTVINGSILYAHVTSQGSGYEYSPKVQINGGGNREISRLSSLLLEGEITAEEYQKGVDAARGKIQSRIEGQVSGINITNPGSGYVAASQLQVENYYSTVPYRTDSVWAPGAIVRGPGYGGEESLSLTPAAPTCGGGGVSASTLPAKKYFQKPVFTMADAFTFYYGYYGNGVAARVESVRGSKRTSRGLRAKKSFTKTLEGLRTENVSGELLAHSGACHFTNVTGKRVRNPEFTPVVYDKINNLFQRGGGGQGLDFRFSQLKFSESSPPKFEVYDKTGTGAVLQTSLDGSGVIDSITFSSDGSSYTDEHRLQVTGGRFRLVPCQATCSVDSQGRISSITVTSPGDGYLSPAVIIHGGGGSGCLATAFLQSGFLPRGVRKIVVESPGSGYSQDSPPSVFVAEFSPPFVETEFGKLINENLLLYRATAWTGMTAEYAKDEELPAFSSPTDYDFDSRVTPIFESGYSWDSSAKAMVDNFATFEYVETTAVDWAQRVPEPYNGNVQITVSGTCDTPLSLTATGASWSKVFGQVDPGGGWGASAIRST